MIENNYLKEYYDNYDEDNRLKQRKGLVEFFTTVKYIEKYLKEGMKICDIGAGTGRYSHYFADKGYEVDALELVDSNIQKFKENIKHGQKITIKQGNALDLSCYGDETYDITLLFGPMYHFYNESDKAKALNEAIRITKKGGLIYVAYCISDASILQYGFVRNQIHDLLEKNMLDTKHFITKSEPIDVFELVRKEDIDRLNSKFDIKREHYVSTDLFTRYMDETINNMDDATFEIYMKYHFFICEREDMCGLTHHSLDVLRKL